MSDPVETLGSADGEFPVENCLHCGVVLDLRGVPPLTVVECPGCGHSMPVLRRFGPFKLERLIAEGGTGAVYGATDVILKRPVALKVLQPAWSGNSVVAGQFEREASMAAMINHPGVVRVYSKGAYSGMLYIAMELVDHGALDVRMEAIGRLPLTEVLAVFRQAAEALSAAHRAGLIHRDVKPGNILFSKDGRVKIVDFGLATVGTHQETREADGELWGTPFYVAPEMLSGQNVDFRADIYALGASMWHALVGDPPCSANTTSIEELLELKRKPLDLRRVLPGVRPEIAALFNRCVAFNPDDRHASYEDLLSEIRAVRRGEKRGSGVTQRLFWAVGAAGFVFACGAFSRFATGRKGETLPQVLESIAEEGPVREPNDRERVQAAFNLLLKGDVEVGEKILRLVFRTPGAEPSLRVWSGISLAVVLWGQDRWLQTQEVLEELQKSPAGSDPKTLPGVSAVRAAALGAEDAQPDLSPDFEMVRQVFQALRAFSAGDVPKALSAIGAAEDIAARPGLPESEGIRRLVPELGRQMRAGPRSGVDSSVKPLLRIRPKGSVPTEGR